MTPRSRAGNWLPSGGLDRYMLVLRLYDTPVGIGTRTQKEAPMPSIMHGGAAHDPLAVCNHRRRSCSAGSCISSACWLSACGCDHARRLFAPLCRSRPLNSRDQVLPAVTPRSAPLPYHGSRPSRSAACRYDLSDGPIKLTAPVSQAYTSVSFYTRSEVAYYAINDRSAGRRVIELDLMTGGTAPLRCRRTRRSPRPTG
jgi:hypothetical protein